MSAHSQANEQLYLHPYLYKFHDFHYRIIARDYRKEKHPLSSWASALRLAIKELRDHARHYSDKLEWALSDTYHQAIDIFIYSGRFQEARELCYTHINMMLSLESRSRARHCIWHGFKSWVLLARIDRILKSERDAHSKLQAYQTIKHEIDMTSLGGGGVIPVFTKTIIRDYHVECIKLFFSTAKMKELIAYLEPLVFKQNQDLFLFDALIIAHVRLGYIGGAVELIHQKIDIKKFTLLSFLRAQELNSCYQLEKIDIMQLILCASKLSALISLPNPSLLHLSLALHVASLLSVQKQPIKARDIIKRVILAAKTIQDDLMLAEALTALFAICEEGAGLAALEKELVNHYHTTLYPSARAMMLKALPDLKHVEINRDFQLLDMLHYDLMTLSKAF